MLASMVVQHICNTRAMQQANAAGIDFEDKALSDLNARSGALRGAAEAGDITGAGTAGMGAYKTGLGPFVKGPKTKKKPDVVKTTKPVKKEYEETSGGTGGIGDFSGDEGGLAG
jgi:hypothetical protein